MQQLQARQRDITTWLADAIRDPAASNEELMHLALMLGRMADVATALSVLLTAYTARIAQDQRAVVKPHSTAHSELRVLNWRV